MKKNKPIIIAILIPLISVMIAGVFVYMGKSKKSVENDSNALPFERYIEAPKSFAGNCYEISASVDSQLAYADNKGRIILLKTFAGKIAADFRSGCDNWIQSECRTALYVPNKNRSGRKACNDRF